MIITVVDVIHSIVIVYRIVMFIYIDFIKV